MRPRSPSQTLLFARCKYKWYLYRKLGVVSSYLGKMDLAGFVGSAVGSSLAMYYNPNDPTKYTVQDLIAIAIERYGQDQDTELSKGRSLIGIPEEIKYPLLIEPMLKAYFRNPAIPDTWEVLGTEYQPDEDHKSFIDIWGKNDRGLWVVDWKCKLSMKAGYIDGELLKYAHSWQLGHYVWCLRQHTGEWPKTAGISLIVGDPTATSRYKEFEVDLDYMAWWEASAKKLWAEMEHYDEILASKPHSIEEAKELLGMSPEHMDGIWKCSATDLCFLYGGDPSNTSEYLTIKES